MLFGRFKKKKRTDLPTPPSLSNKGISMFDEVLGELKAAQGSQTQKLPENVIEAKFVFEPPRKPMPTTPDSNYNIPGPPRVEKSIFFENSQELQGPPMESYKRKLPDPPGTSFERPSPSFGADEVSNEILEELKMKEFHPDLVKAPQKKFIPRSEEDLKRHRLQETKREYLEAANKQLELNFFDNAAIYTACAILCILIADGIDAARSSMSKLSPNLPSGVLDNIIFENVRILLDSTRNKNFTFLSRAEKALRSNMQQLYPEDIAIIESGIKTAKSYFGLE